MAGLANPALDPPSGSPGLSIEFLNVGGWLSGGDLALESQAHFLAAGARSVTSQLRYAGRSSVWAPSCQDVTPGRHAGVGVISLHGAALSLPTIFTPSFNQFCKLGRAMRVVQPLGMGGEGASRTSLSYVGTKALGLTERNRSFQSIYLQRSLPTEAKMCCSGQPVMLAANLNADHSVIPSLAKGMADGTWTDVEKHSPRVEECPPPLPSSPPPTHPPTTAPTCQFQLDEVKALGRTLHLRAPWQCRPPLHAAFCQNAGPPPPTFWRPHGLLCHRLGRHQVYSYLACLLGTMF